MTDHPRLQYLYMRYIAHLASREEAEELLLLLEGMDADVIEVLSHTYPVHYFQEEALPLPDDRAVLQNILLKTADEQERRGRRKIRRLFPGSWWRVAAVFMLVVCTLCTYFIYRLPAKEKATGYSRYKKTTVPDRYFLLPDGSKAIVRTGSRLSYPEKFAEGVRTVQLSGEAYFDIKPDKSHPFVVQTGSLRTTVLGTTFTIQAYQGQKQITVTVTSGKVKVTDRSKVVAVLTRNQQVVYHLNTAVAKQSVVAADTVAAWLQNALHFTAQPFSEIAAQLEERYHVRIQFETPTVAAYKVSAMLNGTETLDAVLSALCAVTGAEYTSDGALFLITEKRVQNK